MKNIIKLTALLGLTIASAPAQTYNALWIPPTLTGTNFNLSLHQTNKQFFPGLNTPTFAYNSGNVWGPTLIMNKGDTVQIYLTNNLNQTTTTHWHGFHIPGIMDGGPHEVIPAGTTWTPTFTILNGASTYWYHPHLHPSTQSQLSYGAGGMIIIQDAQEASLPLPRTYGVDDIPLALTSRRFTTNSGNAIVVTNNCAYGDYQLVNGTVNAQVTVPQQYVRLRILNAEVERAYNLGFSDNRTFYVIATDGGLVNAPIPVTRVSLAVGERVQVLVNLGNTAIGSSINLMAYNSAASLGGAGRTGLQFAYPGGEPSSSGQFGSLLNNQNYNILNLKVGSATTNPITTLPTTLTNNTYWTSNDVSKTRVINITGGTPPNGVFTFDNVAFSMNVINQTLNLNAIEKWVIINNSPFSHSFHIHDIQFNLVSRTSPAGGLNAYEQGWKDTLYTQQNSTNVFIAKFDTFASYYNPFMYHCHFSDHEDQGTMGQFLVVNNSVEDLAIASFTRHGPNGDIALQFKATPGTTYKLQYSKNMDSSSWSDIGTVTSDGTSANFTDTDPTRLAQPRGFYRVTIPVNSY